MGETYDPQGARYQISLLVCLILLCVFTLCGVIYELIRRKRISLKVKPISKWIFLIMVCCVDICFKALFTWDRQEISQASELKLFVCLFVCLHETRDETRCRTFWRSYNIVNTCEHVWPLWTCVTMWGTCFVKPQTSLKIICVYTRKIPYWFIFVAVWYSFRFSYKNYKNSTWTRSKVTCDHVWTHVITRGITCDHMWFWNMFMWNDFKLVWAVNFLALSYLDLSLPFRYLTINKQFNQLNEKIK